jgi:hypothetical protein
MSTDIKMSRPAAELFAVENNFSARRKTSTKIENELCSENLREIYSWGR